jgi:amino-acid N-acetyltransferase
MTTSSAPALRAATRGDFAVVRALLSDAGLPIRDLDSAPGLRMWVAEEGSRIVGTIGLESYGAAGLVRSLVVVPAHRARGLGSVLVARLEQEATARETRLLVLLTETAQPFFKRLGYQVIERGYVPDEVRQSAEFTSLCPASAVCMTKSLAVRESTVSHG